MPAILTASELLIAGMSGAMVVLLGGFYAFFLALHFLRRRRRYQLFAYLSFLLLCLALIILALALHLSTGWRLVIAILMLGYLFAPHLIWKLTQATHHSYNTGGSSYD